METMNQVAMVLGYLVMAAIAGVVLMLVVGFGSGFVKACSMTRFYLAVAKKNNKTLPLRKFPKFFLRQWWQLTGRQPKITGPGGYWHGVGNWKAFREAKQ